ncbi:MAG: 3'(2'),5'-bisphosphate nucleotidase CysQ [Alphaproteobacteria bacterium]|nr:3'(2'),5'-bisphosphate nucleotidase CysQ [Alphaproteobacteria bacterium]
MDDNELRALASKLTGTVLRAGAVTLHYFKNEAQDATRKADGSPVTLADQEAEVLILDDLKRVAPDIPVIAEEAVSRGEVPDVGSRFFLVDPLDGTREFTGGSGEFTVNIGLIENGEPVFGIVYAPALGDIYVTLGRNEAAMAKVPLPGNPGDDELSSLDLTRIASRAVGRDGLTVVASRSHGTSEGESYLEGLPLPVAGRRNIGSSLKFCLVARGEADLYPRHGPTMEWDTAAGHAVLLAAGGLVTTVDGHPFRYGKTEAGYRNTGFIAYASEDLRERLTGATS